MRPTTNWRLWPFTAAVTLAVTSACSPIPPRVHLVNIYQPEARNGRVIVAVRDAQGPVVLALVSSEPVNWMIEIAKDAKLKEVILQGGPRATSRVSGVPADVPIWSEIIGSSSAVGDYGYRMAIHYVRERYGVEPASYQIKYSGLRFEVK